MLAARFLGQFLFTTTETRYFFVALYLAITLMIFVGGGSRRRTLFVSLLLPGRIGEVETGRP